MGGRVGWGGKNTATIPRQSACPHQVFIRLSVSQSIYRLIDLQGEWRWKNKMPERVSRCFMNVHMCLSVDIKHRYIDNDRNVRIQKYMSVCIDKYVCMCVKAYIETIYR